MRCYSTFSYTYVLLFSFCDLLALVISPAFAGGKKGGSVCVVCPPSCTCYVDSVERASAGRQLEGNKTRSHGLVVFFFFFRCLPLHSLVGTLGQVLTVAR